MSLKEYIENTIKEIETWYFDIAMSNSEYQTVWNARVEDLPPMMDRGSEMFNKLVTVRLKGEANIDSPIYTQQVMYDMEFDTDMIKDISYRDGVCKTLAAICSIQLDSFDRWWEELEKRANDCVYDS